MNTGSGLRYDNYIDKIFKIIFAVTKCPVAGHNLMFNARQSENFTDFPMKGPFKLLRINRCLFRNVKRFQKINFFSVNKVSELEYAIIYRSVIDTLLI